MITISYAKNVYLTVYIVKVNINAYSAKVTENFQTVNVVPEWKYI